VIIMLVALNFCFNAELTYFWQPFHVTPVMVATYAVGFASLSAAQAKPRLRVKTPIDAISNFFIFYRAVNTSVNSQAALILNGFLSCVSKKMRILPLSNGPGSAKFRALPPNRALPALSYERNRGSTSIATCTSPGNVSFSMIEARYRVKNLAEVALSISWNRN